jgi:hypothetical protein
VKTTRLDLGPILAGMAVAGAAAVVASGVTLASLAHTAGWDGWTKWLLPAAVDVGGAAAGWAWLRPAFPKPARRFGMVVTLSCALASLAGNAVGHLIEADLLQSSAVLVIIVGAVPAAVLVALAHLAALLTDRSVDSVDPRSTTDTSAVGEGSPSPETAAEAPSPDPIESTPRPPVASSVGSGPKPDPDPAGKPAGSTPTGSAPAPNPAAPIQSGGTPRSKSTRSTRSDDDLRIELAREIEARRLPKEPSAEAIRTTLNIAPAKARMLRDEIKAGKETTATDGAEETEVARG